MKFNDKNIRNIIAVLLIIIPCVSNAQSSRKHSNKINHYVSFLQEKHLSANDYIFSLFEKNDFVVISDRHHAECTQYQFFFDIVTDSRFIEEGGHIYTEVGNQKASSLYRELTLTPQKAVDYKTVISDLCKNFGIYFYWDKRNTYDFLVKLYEYNITQPVEKRILWMGAQKDVDLNSINDPEDFYQNYENTYDFDMAKNIYADYIAYGRKKSLVIMNTRHSYKVNGFCLANERDFITGATQILINTGKEDKFDVAVVLLNNYRSMNKWEKPIDNGKWDAAFSVVGNPQIGFDFEENPFGELPCDYWDKFNKKCPEDKWLKYKDVFDGFVFYNPIDEHYLSWNFPEWFDDEVFVDEYRNHLGKRGVEEKKAKKIILRCKKEKIKTEKYTALWLKEAYISRWLK